MKPSVLTGIIQRLEAMTTTDNEIEVRRFELNGVEKCQVSYDRSTEMFEMTDRETNGVYQFDDLDLVAIEIYELLG
ncbi:YkuJ family protein [Fundicoccus culcitae]|uniref:YkuJ family protein n=1 Tax=Fundicoccus culcitae TaxID=2969821 RepID=A0ABY5P6F9_9LACT|nr:YkuJ family protein [Fundicoccus culcitae]UUX34195.1 YkuJ family protein [Fundicoccus culcitae]